MRKILTGLVVWAFVLSFSGGLYSIEIRDLNGPRFSAGIRLFHEIAGIEFAGDAGVAELESEVISSGLLLELSLAINRNFSLAAMAGYGLTHFKDSVAVTRLPLSLGLEKERNGSMILGLVLNLQPFYWGDFSFHCRGELLYVKQFKNEWDIRLPLTEGRATGDHFFFQETLNILLQYDGFVGVKFFLGPQLNLIQGELTLSEEIGTISAEATLEYSQKTLLGGTAGARFELGRRWEIVATVDYFSRTFFSIEISYLF